MEIVGLILAFVALHQREVGMAVFGVFLGLARA